MESEAQVKSRLPKFIQLTSDRDSIFWKGGVAGKRVILEQYNNEVIVIEII